MNDKLLKEQSHYIRYIHGKHFLGLVQEGVQRRSMVIIPTLTNRMK